jgi:hypothetical protein
VEDQQYAGLFGGTSYRVETAALFIPNTGQGSILWTGGSTIARTAFRFYVAQARASGLADFVIKVPDFDLTRIEAAFPSGRTVLNVTRPNAPMRTIRTRGTNIENDPMFQTIRNSHPNTEPGMVGFRTRSVTQAEINLTVKKNVVQFNDFQTEHLGSRNHPNLGDAWLHILPMMQTINQYAK